VDVTVSCGKSSSADAAEKRKIGHYTDTVANTPGLVFIPFGLTVEGELGQGADMTSSAASQGASPGAKSP
jgi:hypothetical protein